MLAATAFSLLLPGKTVAALSTLAEVDQSVRSQSRTRRNLKLGFCGNSVSFNSSLSPQMLDLFAGISCFHQHFDRVLTARANDGT
mmetsp:Transcript_20090/g.38908  ORF Transcript_20090/g.38908 Transcript_20090/m.38908 type:complete len:85 (+) Transcript_20090:33-287(+)